MLGNRWRTSVQFRLVCSFLVLAWSSLAVVGYLAYARAYRELADSTTLSLAAVIAAQADELRHWMDAQQRDLLILASLPQVQSGAEALSSAHAADTADGTAACAALLTLLSPIRAQKPDLKEIFLLSEVGGRIGCSTEPKQSRDYRVLDEYYVQGRQHTFAQKVYPSPITGEPLITLATPVLDRTGSRRIGVLATHLNLDRFDRVVAMPSGIGSGSEIYLVDRFHNFLSARRFGRDQFPRGAHTEGIDAALGGAAGRGAYANYAGVAVLGAYRWVPELGVALIAETPQRVAFASSGRFVWTIAIVGFAVAGVLAFGVLIIARRITWPIRAITEAASRVAAGDLTVRAPVLTSDEVGALARTFNDMTGKLEQLYGHVRESEARLRSVVAAMAEGVVFQEANGKIVAVNPAAERIQGRSAEQMLGRTSDDPQWQAVREDGSPFPGDRHPAVVTLRTGQPQCDVVMGIRKPDGTLTWISVNSEPLIASGEATPYAVVTTFHDISERKKAEVQARRSEARLRLAVEASSTGLWEWNLDTNEVYFSPEWKRQLGYEEDEVPARFEEWANRLHPDDRARTLAITKRYTDGPPPWPPYEVEFRLRHKDGSYRWILARGSVLPAEGGPSHRMMGSHLDITDRKRAEQALEGSSEQLRQLSASLMTAREAERARIAREVHDELGQALTGLKMDVAWIDRRLPEGPSALRSKALSMSMLIDDTISTVRRIATELRPGVLDDLGLAAAVEWQAQEFEARTGIRCALRTNIDGALLDAETSTAVFRIFQEGLTNVARHAAATTVAAVLQQDGDDLMLEVRDDGRGISDQKTSNLRSIGLTGMRERAQLVGGVFSIAGSPGQGTTIRIRIPLPRRRRHA